MLVYRRMSMEEITRFEKPDEIPKSQKTNMGRIIVIVNPNRRRMSNHDIQIISSLDSLP